MRTGYAVAVACTCLAISSCSDSSDNAAAEVGEAARVIQEAPLDTVWTIRSFREDTLLLDPVRIAAQDDVLAVLDVGRGGVLGFDAASGRLLWTAGQEGGGPGEFRSPGYITAMKEGGFAVGDRANGRISLLSRSGEFLGSFQTLQIPDIHALCSPQPGELLLFTVGSGRLVHMNTDGEVLNRYPSPWPDLRGASVLLTQVTLANVEDGPGSWVALAMGRGFLKFDAEKFGTARECVEHLPMPRVEERVEEEDGRVVRRRNTVVDRRQATYAISANGGDLLIAFQGVSPMRGRLIDIYHSNGSYEHSLALSMRVQALASVDDLVFVLYHGEDEYPALMALRPAEI